MGSGEVTVKVVTGSPEGMFGVIGTLAIWNEDRYIVFVRPVVFPLVRFTVAVLGNGEGLDCTMVPSRNCQVVAYPRASAVAMTFSIAPWMAEFGALGAEALCWVLSANT